MRTRVLSNRRVLRRPRLALAERCAPPAAGPLGTPRICRPGPGRLAVVETAGNWEIDAAGLVLAAPGTPAWGQQALRISGHPYQASGLVTRASQRALLAEIAVEEGACALGFWPGDTLDQAIEAGPELRFNGTLDDHAAFWRPTVYSAGGLGASRFWLAVIPRAAGGWYGAIASPAFGLGWTLTHLDLAGSTANLRAGLTNYDAAGHVRWLALSRSGCGCAPLVDEAAPASGTLYTAAADVLADVKITQGGSLVNGHRAEVRFRYLDSDNFWAVGTVVSGGQAHLVIDEVVGGVRTTRDQKNNIAAAGANLYVQVVVGSFAGASQVVVVHRATRTATTWVQDIDWIGGSSSATGLVPFVSGTPALADLLVYPSRWPWLGRAVPR